MMKARTRWLVMLALLAGSAPVSASVPDTEAAQLGKSLTAVGAERGPGKPTSEPPAANQVQDEFAEALDPPTQVPEWGKAPAGGFDKEKPLFTINSVNLNRYRDNLTESHFSLLQTNPNTFFMKVYPSHRDIRWPQEIESATADNATRCSLKGNDELQQCRLGFPFPIPKNGAEVIWNHKLRWRGDSVTRQNEQLVVKEDGSYQLTRLTEDLEAWYANLKDPETIAGEQREMWRYLSRTLAPPRLEGRLTLIHERAGAGTRGRSAWILAPGVARARRDTKVCCDNPYEGSDGMQFFDQIDMYNGSLERYNWKLLGKREIFVPYHSNRIAAVKRYEDLVRPVHLNQELVRYELHRVWVVEAKLRSGQPHTLKQRRFYVDEDSWTILAVDMLDNLDQPYQFQEAHLMTVPGLPYPVYAAEIIYHLNSGRYFVTGLAPKGRAGEQHGEFPKDHFEAELLNKR